MTTTALVTCGIVLLTVVTIESGGILLLRISNGGVQVNALQHSSYRAGHAHAGVLVILGLVVQLLTSQPSVPGWAASIGSLVLWAAIIMPLGFFLSVLGKEPERRNAWGIAIPVGGVVLAVGLVGAGVGLLAAGTT